MSIIDLQHRLNSLGFPVDPDGYAKPGGETYGAMTAFVRKHVPMDLGPDEVVSTQEEFDLAALALMAMPVTVRRLEDWQVRLVTTSKELGGVDPRLVALAHEATKGSVPFKVTDGLRTLKEQAAYVASGASRTMKSYHLPWTDGLGKAIDVAPLSVGTDVSYRWPLVYALIREFVLAAKRYDAGHDITWGAIWDKRLSELDPDNLEGEVMEYVVRWKRANPRPKNLPKGAPWGPFIDGPHIQCSRA